MSETEYEEDEECNCLLIKSTPISKAEEQQLNTDLQKIRNVIPCEELYAQEIVIHFLRTCMFVVSLAPFMIVINLGDSIFSSPTTYGY